MLLSAETTAAEPGNNPRRWSREHRAGALPHCSHKQLTPDQDITVMAPKPPRCLQRGWRSQCSWTFSSCTFIKSFYEYIHKRFPTIGKDKFLRSGPRHLLHFKPCSAQLHFFKPSFGTKTKLWVPFAVFLKL